ncbi:MAG: efflux transporter outer membrane subunit [Giesbergeria sp.]|jgi:NodT family efflux transporter outer membrane factor (OMF) lipoprotein|nr:efflux transporter outer membrane subunit [Giesbergeria sp.]MBP6159543.1 efflux transporter outer membrane subunit [Giesbergeria sp.]MBP7083698.1 efflux transporter outer membrane subunit [Giesbergeria sp.]MBP9783984.1 efflux transporter outer membrane subunit [Giesbergeria sp.]MBP9894482.1 efflux transporter outer membrane subunit [Giesbergeria sp.]
MKTPFFLAQLAQASLPTRRAPGERVAPWWLTAAIAASLAGCVNLAPLTGTPVAPVPGTVGAGATAAPAQPTAHSLEQAEALAWVQAPQLRQVIALALANNRDLRLALTNIEKARAQYGVQQADRLPTVAASAQANRTRAAQDLTTAGRDQTTSQLVAQIGFVSYELDLWGRVRNLNEAALQQYFLTTENQRNVQVTLVADVANAWLALAADQARLELAQSTLASRRKAFAITQRTYELGATSGLVLAQNQTTVDSARGDVAVYSSQIDRDRNALQLLVGGPVPKALLPGPLASNTPSAAALAELTAPLPSSRLLARPDIQAAEYALRAATANIGAARAALFPTISLTASAGTASNELSNLFGAGNGTWSFVPLVRLPIFDGGRNRANVQVAEANEQLALAQYEKTVQTAFRETADALADRARWAERLEAQASLLAATQKAFDLSEARFKAGVDNYLSVLDAQRSLYAAQQTQITLQLAEQVNRITLYKVLGGS